MLLLPRACLLRVFATFVLTDRGSSRHFKGAKEELPHIPRQSKGMLDDKRAVLTPAPKVSNDPPKAGSCKPCDVEPCKVEVDPPEAETLSVIKPEPQSADGHPGQDATDGVTPVSLSDSESEDESSDKVTHKTEESSGTNTFVLRRPGKEPIVLPRPPNL